VAISCTRPWYALSGKREGVRQPQPWWFSQGQNRKGRPSRPISSHFPVPGSPRYKRQWYPPLAKNAKDGHPRVADAREIKSLGQPARVRREILGVIDVTESGNVG